jgi:hypothetical protein
MLSNGARIRHYPEDDEAKPPSAAVRDGSYQIDGEEVIIAGRCKEESEGKK